jgi:hypothetical protein
MADYKPKVRSLPTPSFSEIDGFPTDKTRLPMINAHHVGQSLTRIPTITRKYR